MIGTTLGKYEILEEIGRGGMAVVYRGFDRELEREVAIKILHPHLSSQPESKRRFHREARAVARLRAPNVLEIFDYSGRDSDQTYIVTEFIHGATLKRFCEEHPEMPTEVAALIGLEICRGLRHAHENEVIHRDIKPENIMIRDDGVVKITDFGIAQMAGTTQMTMTGQILGSPAHMSPEHVENKPLDFRADIFSFGTLLYWMTAGRLPFEGRNPHAVIKRIVEGEYPDPARIRPAMGEHMARIVRRCLEVDPEDRYGTIEELIDELTAFLHDLEMAASAREFRKYFRDPIDYVDQHQLHLVEVLIQRGKEERRARRMPQALHYFNRVLAIDESNEVVLSIVESMTASNRLRRIIEASAVGVTLLAAAVGLSYGFWRGEAPGGEADAAAAVTEPASVVARTDPGDGGATETPPATDGAEVSVDATAIDAAVTSAGEAGTAVSGDAGVLGGDAAVDAAPARSRPTGGDRRRHPAALAKRLVRIVPNPPAARVVIDGRDFGEFGSALARGIALRPGSHQVTLVPRDRMYEELTFQLMVPAASGASEGLLVQNRTLPFRPALVRIDTQVPRATVYVPHRERSRANRVFQVRLNAAEERLQMIVDAEGYQSEVLDVVLHAGQEYSRAVNLEPEARTGGPERSTTP